MERKNFRRAEDNDSISQMRTELIELKSRLSSFTADLTQSKIPIDLLYQSANRLGMASLSLAAVWSFMLFLTYSPYITQIIPFFQCSSIDFNSMLIGITAIGISLILFFITKAGRFTIETIINMGLVYELAIALCMSLTDVVQPLSYESASPGVSWVCVWIIAFSVIVPCPPRKMFWINFTAASIGPIAFLVAFFLGKSVPVRVIVDSWIDNYIVAIIAFLLVRIVYNLGREVKKARQMGSYTLLQKLGSGGMGEVWRAEHKMLKRPAAVKLVKPDSLGVQGSQATMNIIQRFEREAQVTATLHSSHSIQLYDFGMSDNGDFFYVMELLDGIDLSTLVEKYGYVSCARALYFLKQICDSLMDAHLTGLIHRDIKPANIFLCKYGHQYDFIKVLDFGMVKIDSKLQQDDASLTKAGVLAGTPLFMAPEMAEKHGDIDARYDIYALGCVAYWLITGKNVFEAETALQIVVQHINKVPVPPSQRTHAKIPKSMEDVIMACLEKKPENRPQTIVELLGRLDKIALLEIWTADDARQWWENYKKEKTN